MAATRRKWTRRDVLWRLAGAAGAAAAGTPYFVPARALGRDGAVAASERVTMGFIGVGGQGGGHLRGGAWTYLPGGYLARPDVQVLGVCDVQASRREGRLAEVNRYYAARSGQDGYKSAKGYVDFRELLARPDVDAVLFGTPIHWHSVMVILAAEAGKDIYCEKPTALTLADSKAMRDAVVRHGRVFQGGTQQRSEYGGKFRLACELVRSGRIGRLREVYSCIGGGGFVWRPGFGPPRAVPASVDWDLWLGPAPWTPYDGGLNAHRFGDGGTNWGQHHFDIVQWGIGADDTGPVEVAADHMTYANGVVVHCSHYPDPTIGIPGGMRFRGEGGAVFVGTDGKIAVDRQVIIANPPEILRKPIGPDDVHLYNTMSHSGNFLDCVRTRRRTICDIESTHRAACLLVLPSVAGRIGRTLKWDPAAERFVDDDEANRMMSVAWRPPWRL